MRPLVKFCAVLLLAAGVLVPSPANATSHKSASAFDVDTPHYRGYSKKLRAYHFQVTGRWRTVCDKEYCWPAISPGSQGKGIGSKDAVRIRFSDAVQFVKFKIRTFDTCGTRTYRKASKPRSGSFEDAYAGVDDATTVGRARSVFNGKVVYDKVSCYRATMPHRSMSAGSTGGSGTVIYWTNLRGRAFTYDVWVRPAPSRGRCYQRLYVKGGYTHTWSSESLTWSVGYPWGVGVGVTGGSGKVTVWQDTDGYRQDHDLVTPRLCRR